MLLRAYLIRLADGLVASRDQSSVVTDIHRRFPIHFAGAKVEVPDDFKCQVDNKKFVGLPSMRRFGGHFRATGSGILVGCENHRSFAPSIERTC